MDPYTGGPEIEPESESEQQQPRTWTEWAKLSLRNLTIQSLGVIGIVVAHAVWFSVFLLMFLYFWNPGLGKSYGLFLSWKDGVSILVLIFLVRNIGYYPWRKR